MKALAEEFKKQFTCLGKYITFTIPLEKEVTRINKNSYESYKKYILHITIY